MISPPPGKYREVRYEWTGGGGSGVNVLSGEVAGLSELKRSPITAGDIIAQDASENFAGAPKYVLIWPAAKRTAARARIAKWLLNDRFNWQALVKESPFYYGVDMP